MKHFSQKLYVFMVVIKLFEDLSKDFSQLLDESDDFDVIIQVGEQSNFKEFNVYSNILCSRSPYFKIALSSERVNNKNGVITFKNQISPRCISINTSDIQEYIMKIICKDPKLFFELKEFLTLDKDIFLELIKRIDLDIEGIDIWNYLVKWGIAQSIASDEMSANADVTNWKADDFASFKKSLDPFIRFHEISRTYLMANVNLEVSRLPSHFRSINIDSVIIEGDKAAIISNWIEKRTTFAGKPFYQFTLIYRATRDGFDYNEFIANNCNGAILGFTCHRDNKFRSYGNAFTLHNDYNDYRSYSQWESTDDSFIFCFENGKSFDTHIISRVKVPSQAIFNCRSSWLNFGNSDLVLNRKNGSCIQSHYEKKILNDESFVVEELETFVVQKAIN
ncbi:663_t:CDS:2 [Racocetra persica]|uniref:663_t:CDS:1 n=1 Tax=Racocetra persica TaxID=160502 RepID=A0ACA9KNI9_9GLOM|nr:663_t:CDS:2 [Racocetra persica]